MDDLRERMAVFIVDDDASIRDSLSLLLSLRGYRTAIFTCAEDFLQALKADWAGCVVADVKMPGMSGLELQTELVKREPGLPVIIITAHGSVAAARAAFKTEAIDFLEKPFDDAQLIAAIENAFDRERVRLSEHEKATRREATFTALSPREREVMNLLVLGKHNRMIGEELGISPRTVEVHKAHIMSKLGVRDLAELIRLSDPAIGTGKPLRARSNFPT
jgi:FixJ family two-component response regulator